MDRLKFKNHQAETKLFNGRIVIATIFILLLIAILVCRLFYLQVIQYKYYSTLSQQNQLNLIPIDPNRGLIYDRNGVLLAENEPMYSLDIIPEYIKNRKEILNKLQKIITISADDLKQFHKALKQHHPFDRIPLKLKLTDEEVARFYLNQYQLPGVVITARLMRYYPHGDTMESAIGYVSRINEEELKKVDAANYAATNYIGKMGIEKYYEDILHGTVGYQQAETDANGRIVRTVKTIPPIAGDNLYLTIDSRLQIAAEDALGEDQGAVIAIQPSTGQVLAMVSNPRYDPNLFVQGISAKQFKALQDAPDRPLYNRAVRGLFASGSTIKPFYALLGLDGGYVTPDFTIFDPGYFRLPNSKRVFRDWWAGGHGIVNVHKAIVVSCDVYFYTLATKMGVTAMDKFLAKFGFGKPTGIDINEEISGVLPSPEWKRKYRHEEWYPGDTVNFGIGQGYFLVTPLELAKAVSIIANRGIAYKPRLLLKSQLPDGTFVNISPVPDTNVVLKNPRNWDRVISGMEGVITEPHGTANFRYGRLHPPYSIAGKTGTAEVPRPNIYKTMNENQIPFHFRSNSLFIAFAPVDKPQIAVAVLVEHHHGQAVVVAKQVIDYYLINILGMGTKPNDGQQNDYKKTTPANIRESNSQYKNTSVKFPNASHIKPTQNILNSAKYTE